MKEHDQLVSFATAALLKSVGFNIPVDEFYISETGKLYEDGDVFEFTNHNQFPDVTSAPTQTKAQRWLREIHGIEVVIKPFYDSLATPTKRTYSGDVIRITGDGHVVKSLKYNTYEIAMEEGLLNGLILLAK